MELFLSLLVSRGSSLRLKTSSPPSTIFLPSDENEEAARFSGPRAECWRAVPWQGTRAGGGLDCGSVKVLGCGLVVAAPRLWDSGGTANIQFSVVISLFNTRL